MALLYGRTGRHIGGGPRRQHPLRLAADHGGGDETGTYWHLRSRPPRCIWLYRRRIRRRRALSRRAPHGAALAVARSPGGHNGLRARRCTSPEGGWSVSGGAEPHFSSTSDGRFRIWPSENEADHFRRRGHDVDGAEPPRIVFESVAKCVDREGAEALLRRTLAASSAPRGSWSVSMRIESVVGGRSARPRHDCRPRRNDRGSP